MFCNSSLCCNDAGFLQKNNSLDEKNRLVGDFKESSKNQQSCDNSEHFRQTETDFSNLFARGEIIILLFMDFLTIKLDLILSFKSLLFRFLKKNSELNV